MKKLFPVTLMMALVLTSFPLAAQTYNTWNDPDAQDNPASPDQTASDERLQDFVERLRAILDQAEKDRAADPALLKDLRTLADSYDRPWSNVSLNDTFADGDYTGDPVWTVTEGRYFIEANWGLRNVLEEASASGSGDGDVAKQIFGQILNQALGGKQQSRVQATAIFTEAAISNAFAAEIEVSSWVNEGRLILGPYQGNDRVAGYRVAYNVGGSIDLLAVSNRGIRAVQRAPGPFTLEDKKVHLVAIERDRDGRTIVKLDGETIIDVTDQSFRDGFQGWGFATEGGDFIVKQVTVSSAP